MHTSGEAGSGAGEIKENERGRCMDGQTGGYVVLIFLRLDSEDPHKFRVWCRLRL